jgi:hypothetical protein
LRPGPFGLYGSPRPQDRLGFLFGRRGRQNPWTHIAIVSASSALAGVVVSAAVATTQSWLDRRHKRKELLREKYEAMAMLFLDSMKWPSYLLYATSSSQIADSSHPLSANKVHMLCTVYFPRFRAKSGAYIDACTALYDARSHSITLMRRDRLANGPLTILITRTREMFSLPQKDNLQSKIERHANDYAAV